MAEILTSTGECVLVDDEDLPLVLAHRWYVRRHPTMPTVYVQTNVRKPEGGWRTGVTMHRLLLGFPNSAVDHVNGDTFDNRRANLRLATHGQNMVNRPPFGESGFKGVWRNGKNWAARGSVEGVKHYLGTYETAEEAARAYDRWAAEHHGEFAWLNFPGEVPKNDKAAAELLRAMRKGKDDG